jgi:hypothetical protein
MGLSVIINIKADVEVSQGVVKGRLARDDFVVDDGAEGYVDNGLDDWGQEDHYTSEDDEPTKRRCACNSYAATMVYLTFVQPRKPAHPRPVPILRPKANTPTTSSRNQRPLLQPRRPLAHSVPTTKPDLLMKRRIS